MEDALASYIYVLQKGGLLALLHALAQRTTEIVLHEGHNALRYCYAVISEGVKLISTEQKTFIISLGFFSPFG